MREVYFLSSPRDAAICRVPENVKMGQTFAARYRNICSDRSLWPPLKGGYKAYQDRFVLDAKGRLWHRIARNKYRLYTKREQYWREASFLEASPREIRRGLAK